MLQVDEEKQVLPCLDEDTEIWYFSVVDIIQVLIQQPDYQTARKYWNKLKGRLKKEGSESVTNCHRLKLEAADGKQYLMSEAELIFTVLAELSTRKIAETMVATGMDETRSQVKKAEALPKRHGGNSRQRQEER